MSDKKTVRTRVAPSPTGYFHIGTARTALFNYLYAKKNSGEFIVRIEDTDVERSKSKYEADALESLRWLGLDWDEGPDEQKSKKARKQESKKRYGPYRQSERTEIYKKYLEQLLEEGKAYWCTCTKEELEAHRESLAADGLPLRYSGKCRSKSHPASESAVIRFKVLEKEIVFVDEIRGKVTFDSGLLGDIVIAKSLEQPLYNFVVVVDDYKMDISHVIRGEDHLGNTPKQILIGDALGFDVPVYAHLPLILAPDKSKLSKRVGDMDATVRALREGGYVSEAVVNFMLLLGWNPGTDDEVLTLDQAVRQFSFSGIQKGGAMFNLQKLRWFNSHYIKGMKIEDLRERIRDFIPAEWKGDELDGALEMERERMRTLTEFEGLAGFVFQMSDYPRGRLVWKKSDVETAQNHLEKVLDIMQETLDNGLETRVMEYADAEGRGDVLWPLRVALSGQEKSPGPFEIIKTIGREEALQRVKAAVKKISKS